MGNWVESRAASAGSAQPASLRFKANNTKRADYTPSVSSCLTSAKCGVKSVTIPAKAFSLSTQYVLRDVHSRCSHS